VSHRRDGRVPVQHGDGGGHRAWAVGEPDPPRRRRPPQGTSQTHPRAARNASRPGAVAQPDGLRRGRRRGAAGDARLLHPADHARREFTRLRAGQTVTEALAWLRDNPPAERIIYFYVLDDEGRLVGVVPTRRLLLAGPQQRIEEIMVRQTVTLPAEATVLEA